MNQLTTPVLFIIFNRPDTTALVFEKIREVKPKNLFIAADGPRLNKEGEKEKCRLALEIATNVGWECEVKTLIRVENLGCGRAVSEAITWFFDNVEEGIILEDDCLPDSSFFQFCSELLIKYKNNREVFLISGFNGLSKFDTNGSDYFFSKSAGIWGWATWRRAWEMYKFDVPEWEDEQCRNKVLNSLPDDASRSQMKYHLDLLCSSSSTSVSWDYQWWFYRQLNNGLGIVPARNLIWNIGFRDDATHTLDSNHRLAKLQAQEIIFPLNHPLLISDDNAYTQALLPSEQKQTIKFNTNFISELFTAGVSKLKSKVKSSKYY